MERLQDTCSVIDMRNPDRLAFALEHGWVRDVDDMDRMIDYAKEVGAGPDIVAQLLNAKQQMARDLPKAPPDLALCLDPEPESEWATRPCDGGLCVLRYLGADKHAVIPRAIGGKAVVKLGSDLLRPCSWDSMAAADAKL